MRWLTGWLGVLGVACSAATPVPRTGPHTDVDEPVEVRNPPPEPVRVESVGDAPEPEAVWVDGYWHWAGRRWVWLGGMWTVPPAGAYYAPPTVVRLPVPVYEDGEVEGPRRLRGYGMTLLYLPGHWHLVDGSVAPVEPLGQSAAQ